jgi:hypothetical protein
MYDSYVALIDVCNVISAVDRLYSLFVAKRTIRLQVSKPSSVRQRSLMSQFLVFLSNL